MKRHWIEFYDDRPKSPLSFWVHRPADGTAVWIYASEFDPPLQPLVPGKGYPCFFVEFDGFTFEFASLEEIRHCIAVLGQRHLPRSTDLAQERGTTKGPNSIG